MSKIVDTMLVELVGGPHDGRICQVKRPARPLIIFQSPMRSDIQYVYEFDKDPQNCDEPFKFKFESYQNKKIDKDTSL